MFARLKDWRRIATRYASADYGPIIVVAIPENPT